MCGKDTKLRSYATTSEVRDDGKSCVRVRSFSEVGWKGHARAYLDGAGGFLVDASGLRALTCP